MSKHTPLDATRVSHIASAIRGEMRPMLDAGEASATAKDGLDNAKDANVNVREGLAVRLASLSQSGGWTRAECDAGARMAVSRENDVTTQKAVGTYLAEMKYAMQPDVRMRVQGIVDIRDAAWDAETASRTGDKSAPTPLRDFFKRKYHALVSMLRLAGDDGTMFTGAAHLVAYAVARNPALDPEKVAKRIAAMAAELAVIAGAFPDMDVAQCAETLGRVTVADLAGARPSKVWLPEPEPEPAAKPTFPAPKPVPVPAPTPALVETDVLAALDDLIGPAFQVAA